MLPPKGKAPPDQARQPENRQRAGLFHPWPPMRAADALISERRAVLGWRCAAALLFAIAFLWPTVSEQSLASIFAGYVFADGAIVLAAGGWSLAKRRVWPVLAGGCINIVVAATAYVWPAMTPPLLANIAAVWAITVGVVFTAASVSLRRADREYLLLLCGIAALVFARALLTHLAGDAIILSTWMGLYTLTIGMVLLRLTLQHCQPILDGPL